MRAELLPAAALIPATRRLILCVLAASVVALAVLFAETGIGISSAHHGFALITVPIVILAAIAYADRTYPSMVQGKAAQFSINLVLFMAISLVGVLSSYPAAAQTSGFYDPELARADQVLHFDWVFWYRAVSASPLLQVLGAMAYSAIYISPIVLLAYFARVRDQRGAHKFLLTFWLAALLTLLVFPLFPAEGPLAFLWRGPIPYMPTSALYQEQLIPALRDHRISSIDLGSLRGLVCAPSFHSASAVLYMAAAWPLSRLRWPLIAVNLAMLAATPIEGTHYLTDIIAGAGIAIIALVAVGLLTQPRPWDFRVFQRYNR